ncbi:tubulin polyglutamylase TTLL5 [Rhinophrynus dorsalis]
MPEPMNGEPPDTGEEEPGPGEYSCILWTRSSRKVPILMFHAEAILSKELSLHAVGERYRLSYKIVRTDSRLVRSILTAHGFQEVNANSNDFNIMWTGSHVKPHVMRNMASFQKVNHFPRSYELTRKDRLYKNMQRMQQNHGVRNFHLLPQTYLLPAEYQDFCNAFSKDRGPWIVKPVASSRGRGVYLVNSPSQISMADNILVSRYISNPLLIDGFKFDVRLYVLITSYDPLLIYLYEEGLTRFATVRYERTAKHIKNQFMHLTNYSVNKKSGDYVSCDDPEVEDYGNKWSMSAMLRYLKQDGRNTAALMSQVEDLIIKTVISGELSIASACKSFLSHRGNCFELYGFDVLIDANLKPWLLEVNLSPSLACDAPLDLKVKASMISDMLTLIGVECQDPHQRLAHVGSAVYDKRTQKPTRPLSASDVDTRLQGGSREKGTRQAGSTLGLSVEEVKILHRVQDEAERTGGFVRIFPRIDTWQLYGSFLEHKTSMNYMLATHLFPNRPPVTGAGEQSSACDSKMHSVLYERKLVSLQHRRARHRGLARRAGVSHSHHHSEQEEEEEEADEQELEEVQDQVVHSVESSQVAHVQPPPPPRINLMDLLQKDANLSKLQARAAFSCYLERVQSRLQSEREPEKPQPKEEEQMELVMRFLHRAAGNLQHSVCLTLPGRSVPFMERRRLLAKLLGDFIRLYNQETQSMRSSEEKQDSADNGINPLEFQTFVAGASECELEEVLTFYTRKNKSASVFLGTSGNMKRGEMQERQEGTRCHGTNESSVTVRLGTNQQSGNKSGHVPGRAGSEAPVPSSDSRVSALTESREPRVNPSQMLPLEISSITPSSGSNMHISVPTGIWAQPVHSSHTSSLGTFSTFQSAAQIYSQKLSRPSSARPAISQQSALRSRCASAGVVKELKDPYNESAVTASLQRLAEKQASRQYSNQLRLLTQQLTHMNIVSSALGRARLRIGSAPRTLVSTVHTDAEPLETGASYSHRTRSAWESDQETITYSPLSGISAHPRNQPVVTSGGSQNPPLQQQSIARRVPPSGTISSTLLTNQTCTIFPTPPANHKQHVTRKLSASRVGRVGLVDEHQRPGPVLSSDIGAPTQDAMESTQIIFARSRPPVPPPRTTSKVQRKIDGQTCPL